MIAARLAGGNLFFGFLGWGIFWWGFFLSTRSGSEHSDFFWWGFFGGGILFLGGWGVFWIESVGKN